MAWGEFEMVHGWVHIAPTDDQGWQTEPHDLRSRCWCAPELVPIRGVTGWPSVFVVKHRDEADRVLSR